MENHHDHHFPGSDIDRRLSKLEAVVESLASNVGRVTDDIGHLAQHLQQRAQTNWGTIFAGITLVVLLVTGYVGLPLNALQNQFNQHKERQEKTNLQANEYHAGLATRLRALEASAAADVERMLNLEREVYAGAQYRQGRPLKYPERPTDPNN